MLLGELIQKKHTYTVMGELDNGGPPQSRLLIGNADIV